MCHKVSEGSYYEDPYWPTVQQWCQQNSLPVIGYHYVNSLTPELAGTPTQGVAYRRKVAQKNWFVADSVNPLDPGPHRAPVEIEILHRHRLGPVLPRQVES